MRLPTNFKAATFDADAHTAILRNLEKDVEAARFDDGSGQKVELPVKLNVHDSIWVPLAKWPMLMAGNYRCVTKDGMRPIKDTVHGDIAVSRGVYDWVVKLCVSLGAAEKDLVPFDKYATAALSLLSPSSAARALYGGAPNIERVDRLVQAIAKQKGLSNARHRRSGQAGGRAAGNQVRPGLWDLALALRMRSIKPNSPNSDSLIAGIITLA